MKNISTLAIALASGGAFAAPAPVENQACTTYWTKACLDGQDGSAAIFADNDGVGGLELNSIKGFVGKPGVDQVRVFQFNRDKTTIQNNTGAQLEINGGFTKLRSSGLGSMWVEDSGVTIVAPNHFTRFMADGVHFNDQQLMGVANGTEDTDAVNLGQLNEAISNISVGSGDKVLGTSNPVGSNGTPNAEHESWALGTTATTNGPGAVATGHGAIADQYGVATGFLSQTQGVAGTALGDQSKALADYASAIGFMAEASGQSALALGHASKAQEDNSVALGSGSIADRTNTISVGSTGAERQITNVKAGIEDTDAVNFAQLKTVETKADDAQNTANQASTIAGAAQTTANQALTRANDAHTRIDTLDTRVTNIEGDVNTLKTDMTAVKGDIIRLDGRIDHIATDIANSTQEAKDYTDSQIAKETEAREAADTALNARIDTEKAERIAADNAATTDREKIRTEFAAADAKEKAERVAADNAATADRAKIRDEFAAADAVLQANIDAEAVIRADADAKEKAERIAADNAATADRTKIRDEFAAADAKEKSERIAADNAATADRAAIRTEMAQGDAQTLASSKAYTDQRINKLENRYQAAVASSIAIASLPQPTEAGGSMVSAGLGQWESETGYAIGVSGVTENNKWVYKAAGTGNSRGNWGGGVSVGFQWK
ncbi:hypothetical protein F2A31_05530 [Acinetobacter suaedae]|uniref:Trimeric autotransporter adhesin YadA-like C-terminal membrane anchor domain-containing protein n=1 Tax=Acinetobacter suaedae TaxID=2609668 RepID=A0A5P1UQI8_9GAMM|nr:YadA-like family protein [Acinetobacter sp. C16S1]QER39191.1 hypothetical protein F2A31_05530 [Acinetobacter sp. C16S1]